MKSAIKVVASTFGIVVGLAGLEHGTGEILQGNVPPSSLMFPSWPDSEFLRILAGEPAMTILPSMLVAGIVTVLVALLMMAWSVRLPPRPLAGWGLMLLSVMLLLAGGGMAPPLMGIIVGIAATRIASPLSWWRARRPDARPPLLGRLWRPILILSVASYVAMLPGVPILAQLVGDVDHTVIYSLGLFSFATLLLAVVGALAWDSYHAATRSEEAR